MLFLVDFVHTLFLFFSDILATVQTVLVLHTIHVYVRVVFV
jgi:hypothetical protein